MAKKSKILILLLGILLVLILYLIFTSESIKPENNVNKQVKPDNLAGLETNYKLQAREFFLAYEALIKNNNITQQNITELENKLLALKVPVKFKELHLRFVLALNRTENYLNQKDEREKGDSFQAISQLKADYSWLNN
ncbi:MAG: hypothetical protein HYV53_03830 [Parcubacteria group bacterium]|nr:hypothetical protein [Parcubacteria group bacterium]